MRFSRAPLLTALAVAVCFVGCDRQRGAANSTVTSPAATPTTPSTGGGDTMRPVSEFKIDRYAIERGTHTWKLSANSISDVAVRLHVIANGESAILSESHLKANETTTWPATVDITLKMTDDADAVSPVMVVSSENLEPHLSNVEESLEFPSGLFEGSSAEVIMRDGSLPLNSEEPRIVYRSVFFPETGGSFDEDGLDSMTEASNTGLSFVVVSVQVQAMSDG